MSLYVYGTGKTLNTLNEIARFFDTPGRPVNIEEFASFWHSLTDAQKDYYFYAKLD